MHRRTRLATTVLLVTALIICSSATGLAGTGPAAAPERVQVLIGFDSTPGLAEEAIVRAAGGSVQHRYHLIPAIAAELPEMAIANLARNPRITVIEPVMKVYALNYQQELDNTWGVKRIGAGAVHAAGVFGGGVKVAVIDSGIDYTHPEFAGIYAGGYDFFNNTPDPMDDSGHGTHVAGTIAAARDGTGVVGVAPGVELYALKVLGADGSGSYADVIKALEWAVANGIHITNNSYGSSGDPGTLVKAAFDNAYAAGMLHVSSAGNAGNSPGRGDNVGFPAKYSSVIAVAATGTSDKRASWSSTGPAVELSAPGVSIRSTLPGGGYGLASGTSMAAPHVAGTAALVWSVQTNPTNVSVRNRLAETAIPLGAPEHYGHGLVDAQAAVGSVQTPSYTITVSANPQEGGTVTGAGTYTEGSQATVTATASYGWEFVNWTENGLEVSVNASFQFTVTEPRQLVANFEQSGSPPGDGIVSVTSIEYSTSGGKDKDRHLHISLTLVSDGLPVSGASVSCQLYRDDGLVVTLSGTTGSDGKVVLSYNNAPAGNYTTTVTGVVATGLTWDEVTPTNGYQK